MTEIQKTDPGFNSCVRCTHWLRERRTEYVDSGQRVSFLATGESIVTFSPPPGQGHCRKFDRPEPADFGCIRFEWIRDLSEQVEVTRKAGAPWQHFKMIPCPDCRGKGEGTRRHRCAGTGLVRLYDDGYVGDEQTRKHPKEIAWEAEHGAPPPAPSFLGSAVLKPLPEKTDPQNDPHPLPDEFTL